MDVVLTGLPGSGKSVVGKRLAHRHGAAFVDLDDQIEREAHRSIPEIFAEDGEVAFRAMERAAIDALGPPSAGSGVERVIATGGGAIVDPRNRWSLHRGRLVVWLDGRPEVLAQRLRRSPHVRPLVAGRDPIGAIRDLATRRERFYAAADLRVRGVADVGQVLDAVSAHLDDPGLVAADLRGTTLVRAATGIGRIVIGDDIAVRAIAEALHEARARRAILVSEPGAWAAVGARIGEGLAADGLGRRDGDAAPG